MACTGPGTRGRECGLAVYSLGLCRGHYAQWARRVAKGETSPMRPLRDSEAEPREVLSLRVSPEAKASAAADPEGAREAIERWAKRRH